MSAGTKVTVNVKNNDVEFALRRFKTKVAKSGIPADLKKHREYTKPGVRRREEEKENKRNFHKRNKRG